MGSPNRKKQEKGLEEFKSSILQGTISHTVLRSLQDKVTGYQSIDPLAEFYYEFQKNQYLEKKLSLVKYLSIGVPLMIFTWLFLFIPLKKFAQGKKWQSGNEITSENKFKGIEKSSPSLGFPKIAQNAGKQQIKIPHLLPEEINFCGELVPMNDQKISGRMKVAIHKARFTRHESLTIKLKMRKWFPVIAPILKKYNIPNDFKYIPLVESGFTNSVSNRGAGGFWQLMQGTAMQYGLVVNDSTDERLNVKKCTVAACKYIRDIHKQLGSWTLTAAAFNMGLGGLQNKVDSQNKRDYYHLKLNAETAKYVYKTLAFKEILETPKHKTRPSAG